MEGHKILVVEDEPSMQNVLVDKLGQSGFNVFRAGNGKEALEIVLKEEISLILLDLLMPFMNGLEFLDALNKEKLEKKPIIIFLSNYIDPFKINKALKNGAKDYLIKSDCNMRDIVKRVKSELS